MNNLHHLKQPRRPSEVEMYLQEIGRIDRERADVERKKRERFATYEIASWCFLFVALLLLMVGYEASALAMVISSVAMIGIQVTMVRP